MNIKGEILKNTIDYQDKRLSKFINTKNNNGIPKRNPKKERDSSINLTAEAMKVFYNSKSALKPQISYRWENVKNMGDYVELGNLTKQGEFNREKIYSRNNQNNISPWNSFMNKSESDNKLSTRKVSGYTSQERIKLLMNPDMDNSKYDQKSGKRLCSSRNKNGSSGSIKVFMDNTPELKIKTTPFTKKFNEGTDFLCPSWNFQTSPIKKNIDIEKIRKNKTYAGLSAPKKTEMSQVEVLRYIQNNKQKEVYNCNIGKPLEFLLNLDNKNFSINPKTNFDKLSRNKSSKSVISNSTGISRDTRTMKSRMTKTIDY